MTQSNNASPARVTRRTYTHNPYQRAAGSVQQHCVSQQKHAAEPAANDIDVHAIAEQVRATYESVVHAATLHRELIGKIGFVPYPTESISFENANDDSATSRSSSIASHDNRHSDNNSDDGNDISSDPITRVFVGQLPYRVTEMQLQWLFHVFGRGAKIFNPERITKKSKTGGARVPTGCIHANLRESQLKQVVQCMHKRLLVDDSGVWVARDDVEKDILDSYVSALKAQPTRRFPDRPYDSIVVQEAVSAFQAPQPRWVSNAPELEQYAPSFSMTHFHNNNNVSHQMQQPQHFVQPTGFANNHHQSFGYWNHQQNFQQ